MKECLSAVTMILKREANARDQTRCNATFNLMPKTRKWLFLFLFFQSFSYLFPAFSVRKRPYPMQGEARKENGETSWVLSSLLVARCMRNSRQVINKPFSRWIDDVRMSTVSLTREDMEPYVRRRREKVDRRVESSRSRNPDGIAAKPKAKMLRDLKTDLTGRRV